MRSCKNFIICLKRFSVASIGLVAAAYASDGLPELGLGCPIAAMKQALPELKEQVAREQAESPRSNGETPTREQGDASLDVPAQLPEQTELEKQKVAETVRVEGIDTFDLEEPQGNWLLKRMWGEQAEERYEQVRVLADRVLEMPAEFLRRNTDLERSILEPFYRTIGATRVELQQHVDGLVAQLEQEREQQGELTDREREGIVRLKESEDTIRDLRDDVERIRFIDQDLDQVIVRITEATGRVRRHERAAWSALREISRMLSDERAREAYFKIDEAWRNIANIEHYVREQLEPHFDRVAASAQGYTVRVTRVLEELKQKGIALKKDVQEAVKDEPVPSRVDDDEDDEEEQAPTGGILSYLTAPFRLVGTLAATIWDGFIRVVRLPYDLLFGLPVADVDEDDDEVDEE